MSHNTMFYRDTWAEIHLDKIMYNVTQLKKHLPNHVQMIAVVKANAYGHGDVQVARAALEAGATYLAVAFLDEAIALRKKGIIAPILVLGASRPEDIPVAVKNNITLTVFRYEWLQQAKGMLGEGEKLSIHIKIDTGMGRIGVRSREELTSIEELLESSGCFLFEGIYTHFATADELEESYFRKQLSQFHELLSYLRVKPDMVHASNSAASFRFGEASFNAIRFGIGMYGLTPSLEMESVLPFPLQQAFSLHTRLVHVKKLEKGESVSYGATYTALEPEWIGTLPIGYADGWIRKLHGQEVLIEGDRVPIVGRICMDQCMIRLPKELPVGTLVTLIGEQEADFISMNEIATKLETINYEVPCIISSRVPRIYKKYGKMVEQRNDILQTYV
ncbi:alanine racemase [Robertmurraya korlensis]|uniref:alanine racemase n=1 Tax=Robertmurraya korlensis TaxID=519977 RepID=UPI00203B0602|nr:alanine racemase [Robertmurraya korlensis]MCM3603239.1 alanine racemase [Robertmurraya korlensis]